MRGKTDIPTVEIGLVLYPGAQDAALRGLTDLFAVADRTVCRDDDVPALRIGHYDDGRRVFDTAPRATSVLKALIVPPSLDDPLAVGMPPSVGPWLKARHADGAMLAGVCSGVFTLGAAGVLADRRVTAHAMYAAELVRRHPGLRMEPDRALLDDGDILTGAGLMSWAGIGLRIIERVLGTQAMRDTARYMQVEPPGGDAPRGHVFVPDFAHGDAAVLRVQHRLHRAGTRGTGIAAMAAEAGLGERTFLRRFVKATGMKPTAYCQHLRVAEACTMLAATRWPVDRIAWRVGYDDTASFRKVFVRIVGTSPTDYRRAALTAA
ncbi:GlxA family transcriptional regulator [Luteibacter sp. CQ10]|uniref:GlxA family transcriptional regulator n=1 Tax=Luteibacter sp. CQ10 TaxID=2805821 RepID=UPI0034A18060